MHDRVTPSSPSLATLTAEYLSHRVSVLLSLHILWQVEAQALSTKWDASCLSNYFSSSPGHLSLTVKKGPVQWHMTLRGFLWASNWNEGFCFFDEALNLQLYACKACASTTTSSPSYGCASGRANPYSYSMNLKLRGACSKC